MLSNGDDLWPSGVLSREEIEIREGLTLEAAAWFAFTGKHWQELEVALVPSGGAIVEGERSLQARVAFWWVAGPSPEYGEPTYACGTGPDARLTSSGWTLGEANGAWHRLVISIQPDWTVECHFDGKSLGTFQVPTSLRVPRVAVMLGGRTYQTTIYHGPLVATRP